MKCMSFADVMRLYAGQVSPEDKEDIDNHLDRCDRCANLRDEIEDMTTGLSPDQGEFHDPELTEEVMTLIRLGQATKAAERQARGDFWKQWQIWLLVPATAAATAIFSFAVRPQSQPVEDVGFQARSALNKNPDRWVSLQTFRKSDQGYEPIAREVLADDTLAFAYQNRQPSHFQHLMVFAVDGHGEVYWYYPAHTDETKNPTSVEIRRAREPIPLPDQIKHKVAIGPIRLFGLFSNVPLDVSSVEKKVVTHFNEVGSVVGLQRIAIENTGQHSLLVDAVAPPKSKGK